VELLKSLYIQDHLHI